MDVALALGRPKRQFENVVGLLEHIFRDVETLKDLDGPALHAIGLAVY